MRIERAQSPGKQLTRAGSTPAACVKNYNLREVFLVSKFMYEMTSEEAKKVIEGFYSEATPEELLKIVVEAGY